MKNTRYSTLNHYQTQTTECGLASMAMILSYYGCHVSLSELREVSGVSRDCISAADLVHIARHYGLQPKVRRCEPRSLANIKQPVVAYLNFIHFLVIEAVTDDGVEVNDPACGKHCIPHEQFNESFTGIVLEFTKGPDFKAGGEYRSVFSRLRDQLSTDAKTPLILGALLGFFYSLPLLLFAAVIGQLAYLTLPVTAAEEGAVLSLAAILQSPLSGPFNGILSDFSTGYILLIAIVLQGGSVWLHARASDRLALDSQQQRTTGLLRHLLTLPQAFFVYRIAVVLHNRVCDHERLATLIYGQWLPGVLHTMGLVVPLIVLGLLAPVTSLLVSLSLAAYLWLLFTVERKGTRLNRNQSERQDAAWIALAHVLENFDSFKTSGGDRAIVSRSMDGVAGTLNSQQRAGILWGFAELSVGLFIVLSLLMVIVVSQLTMSDAASGFMNLVMSLCLVLMMLEPLKRLTALQGKTDSIKRALVPIDDLFEEQPDPEDSPQISSSDSVMDTPKHLADNVPLLVAHRLRFGFTPVKPALLRDLSLTVAAGERLGITGASGGGKSTLAELLVGLHRPWQGAVYLQGQRIEHWSKPQLSQKIGWVNKHPYFIHGTVRDNLLLWRDPVADDVLQNALHDACLQEVLTALPAGLDTPVAAEGANFSGGQRQRLEIARALLTRPSLLLLDEATDGLDHELELRLLTRLRQRGLTVILVSHRASTLAACDRRVRLVDGQLLTEDDPPLTTSEAQLTPDSGNTRQASNQRMDQRFSGGSVLTEPAAVNAHPEALLKAFRRVAAAIGEPPIKPLPNSLSKEKANQGYHGQTADETHIHALARYNQLAVREVRFVEQQWWQRDHGPLLVFDQETRQPLAVVPNNQGIYQAINPVTGISRSLTPEVSELLAPRAFVLYPRFDRSLAISGSLRTPLLKPDLIWALVCSLLITVLVMAVPVAGYLLQAELHPAANAQIITHWQIGLILLMTWLATESLRVYALLRIEGRLELSTCLMLYQHLVRLRPAFFTKHTPQSINRSLHSIPRLFDSLRNGTLRRLLAGLNGCAGLIFIALFSVKLALVAVLLLAPLFMIPLWLTVLRNTGYAAQMARRLDAIQTSRILLHNASRIRQAGHHWAMFDVWHKQYRQALDLLSPMLRLDSLAKAFEVFYPWLALSGFMLVVTLAQIAQGELPAVHAGQWLALLLAFMVTSLSFQGLSRALCDLLKALPMLKQLEPLLNAPLEPESGQEEKTRAELSGIAPIEVRNLSFMYPGVAQPLFKEVSMRIQPGEFVVLTGPSGGGKSTLLRILLGFLANDSGEIVRDGQRQDENSALSHWRDSVATVLQEEQLLVAQSIRGHITGGDFYSMEHVFEAARLAMLEDDIAAMPMGIQSIINSDTVSTGQKQRLLIANRLLRHPRLLILDESTNAIPEAIQVQLFANLRSIGVTCLVVSHRASVIAEADRVYVLNNGTMSQLRPETKQTGGLQQ